MTLPEAHRLLFINCDDLCFNKCLPVVNQIYDDFEHQLADYKKRIAEHRLVMEESLGRFLNENEVVHHKDENTLNNDISNLQLMTPLEHIKHHIEERRRNQDGKFTI